MTREEAKELLPIIQAWVEGKTIQYFNISEDKWCDIPSNVNVAFTLIYLLHISSIVIILFFYFSKYNIFTVCSF